jgi:hypothetical protein
MGVEIILTGAKELIARLEAAPAEANLELAAALYQEGEAIMRDALPITPIDLGNLRSSAHVDLPKTTGLGQYEVVLGFGGASAPYALYVHENLEARHDAPTQAKFLETPMNAHAADFSARMAALMKLEI